MAKKSSKNVGDDLAEIIADSINKLHKNEGQVAYINQQSNPSDLVEFCSTGCSVLDLAIANRPHGGIAFGRITELNGLEGSGKSLIAAHLMANVQEMGGIAVLIDTETAMNSEFFDAIGLDLNKNFIYISLETVEDIFETVENIIETVRRSDKDRPVLIVVDSIAAASTKAEMEADYDKDGYATGKAIIMGKSLRKITSLIGKEKIALVITNQLRQKMNAMPFSDPWTTSGGKALAFHASTIVRLALAGQIKNKDKDVIGVKVLAKVIKNRVGPPHRRAEFNIYFDRGIDNYGSWLDFFKKKDMITGTAKKFTYKANDGTEHTFTEKTWVNFLEENPAIYEELYLKLCEGIIMQYKSIGLTASDVEEEDIV